MKNLEKIGSYAPFVCGFMVTLFAGLLYGPTSAHAGISLVASPVGLANCTKCVHEPTYWDCDDSSVRQYCKKESAALCKNISYPGFKCKEKAVIVNPS